MIIHGWILVIVHLLLWLSWRIHTAKERQTRPRGYQIPKTYLTSDIGNPVGFSFVAYALAGVSYIDVTTVNMAVAVGVVVSYILNLWWSKNARQRSTPTSGYRPNGRSTRGGQLHVLYTGVVTAAVCLFVWNALHTTPDAISLWCFGIGFFVYTTTVIIDARKGIL